MVLDSTIIVGVLSLIGTLIGSLSGIFAANKLTTYRIGQLEEKVNKHNNLIERMVAVEASAKSAHKRLDEDRKSTRLNSSHPSSARMPSSA